MYIHMYVWEKSEFHNVPNKCRNRGVGYSVRVYRNLKRYVALKIIGVHFKLLNNVEKRILMKLLQEYPFQNHTNILDNLLKHLGIPNFTRNF